MAESPPIKDESCYAYHPFFCEENVYHLARDVNEENRDLVFEVLFFINAEKTVAMSHQKAFGDLGNGCWDYHVVLYLPLQSQIVDFDSTLGFCTDSVEYFQRSFPNQAGIEERYRAVVRQVTGQDFVDSFWSDRKHMKDESGVPLAPFPPWPAIQNGPNKLRLVDLREAFFDDQRIRDQPLQQFLSQVP